MGKFTLKSIKSLNSPSSDLILEESDFSLLVGEDFLQFDYVKDENEIETYEVQPGIYSISSRNRKLLLEETSFVKDSILNDLISTVHIENAVNTFTSNIHLYKEFGIEVAKRSILIYGPQGTGKTTAISKIIDQYGNDGKTAVVVWHTAKWESGEVKGFIKSFVYTNGVERLILVAEDLGGIESDKTDINSDSSLLSLLDNQEKTFTIPTIIIATTNFPEMFMANITNRPGRFDDKIEVGFPNSENRGKLLEFYSKDRCTEDALDYLKSERCENFSAAHIREGYIRSRLKNIPLLDSLKELSSEIEKFNSGFKKTKRTGIGIFDD